MLRSIQIGHNLSTSKVQFVVHKVLNSGIQIDSRTCVFLDNILDHQISVSHLVVFLCIDVPPIILGFFHEFRYFSDLQDVHFSIRKNLSLIFQTNKT
jgi:hypothetical protein